MSDPGARPLEDLLAQWLPGRRWFPAKGRAVDVRVVADITLPLPRAQPGVRAAVLVVDLVPVDPAQDTVHVQVPVVLRERPGDPDDGSEAIGWVATPDGGRLLRDGTSDPAYVDALLALMSAPATVRDASGWLGSVPAATGVVPAVTVTPGPSRVLTGEQSNTSVIVEPPGGTPVIVKVFRVLQAGDNPDIVLQNALSATGSGRVARPAGSVRGGWPAGEHGEIVADLAVATEFLPGAQDAWRTALAALAGGRPFDTDARDLGAALAEVHAALGRALPRRPATPALLAHLADSVAERVRWAADAAPVIDATLQAAALAEVSRLRQVTTAPDWQRIHGDLHLGQVLRPPGRGWVLLDFEGEPLRPLAERCEPDTPLRDVAGMLRSFDYAGAFARDQGPTRADAAAAWVRGAREAFCEGYAAVSGRDPRLDAVMLAVLELEKALYEVVYETRNRPDWVAVPLGAVHRLLQAGRGVAVP